MDDDGSTSGHHHPGVSNSAALIHPCPRILGPEFFNHLFWREIPCRLAGIMVSALVNPWLAGVWGVAEVAR